MLMEIFPGLISNFLPRLDFANTLATKCIQERLHWHWSYNSTGFSG